MTDAERISAAIEMLKKRLYWLEIQYNKASSLINTGDYKGIDLGMIAERKCMLGREKIRIDIILDVLERGYFSADMMLLFTGIAD